jgi:hypothetical protein
MSKLTLVLLLAALSSFAAVRQVRVLERTDVSGGTAFGNAGPYERLVMKAEFAVDPANAANQIITDIDYAPKGENGAVEFSSDAIVLKPRDPAKGNGTILFEVSNRGGTGLLRMFNAGGANEVGDRYLMEQGYTLVWVGWQFDVPKDRALKLYAPVARFADGKPIIGLVRSEFVPNAATKIMPLADRDHSPYAPIDQNDKGARLTVRDRPESPARPIERSAWSFVDGSKISMTGGFEAGKIYELVYRAQDPSIVGLGPAAIRDFVTYLKHGGGEADSALGDQSRFLKRAIGFGTSQSGRFLRTFLYYGFNLDEQGRKVFDGVWAHVGGAGRGSFNIRFAQPSRDGHPLMNLFYPTDLFPFTDLPESDPETGATAGLLDRTLNTKGAPKIFYTNGSYEYWGRAASLIHTTADGKQDAPLAADTRIYYLAGTQHGPGARPERNHTQNRVNPANYTWTMRALLTSMNAWLKEGVAPPESQYPRIDRDQLASAQATPFPKMPGAALPTTMYHAFHLDFGPEFASTGVIAQEPPKIGKPFPQLVPRVSLEDGNEIAGIRSVDLRVPVATYTGWNLRAQEIGSPDSLYDMAGSFIPFPRTKAEREASGDGRPSIEERYASRDEYLSKVKAAAADLVSQRFLLEGDVPRVIAEAAARWDLVMK